MGIVLYRAGEQGYRASILGTGVFSCRLKVVCAWQGSNLRTHWLDFSVENYLSW